MGRLMQQGHCCDGKVVCSYSPPRHKRRTSAVLSLFHIGEINILINFNFVFYFNFLNQDFNTFLHLNMSIGPQSKVNGEGLLLRRIYVKSSFFTGRGSHVHSLLQTINFSAICSVIAWKPRRMVFTRWRPTNFPWWRDNVVHSQKDTGGWLPAHLQTKAPN